MIGSFVSRLAIIAFGALYPAYYSYKTLHAKCIHEYSKWLRYWIVFALFTTIEHFTDFLLAWLPFYYEGKVALILWLLPSIGSGSVTMYDNYLYPLLKKHEPRMDRAIRQMKEKGRIMVCSYVSTSIMYIGRVVLDFVHRNMPNTIVALMHHGHGLESPTVRSQELVRNERQHEEELLDFSPSTSEMNNGHRRIVAKPTADVHTNDDKVKAKRGRSRSRGRQLRQARMESDLIED